MKVYIAAPYAARELAKSYADELATIGIQCTSNWITETKEIDDEATGVASGLGDDEVKQCVDINIRDIEHADVLVHLAAEHVWRNDETKCASPSAPLLNSGGRHVELGYALALGKHIINVGDVENVFHRARAINVADWHKAVLALVRIKDQLVQTTSSIVVNHSNGARAVWGESK